mgnify:CR=1 FL=1
MSLEFPKISPIGERGILVEFEPEISPEVLQKVLFFKNKIENYCIKEKVEVINTYNSLLISYPYTIENIDIAFSDIKTLFEGTNIPKLATLQTYYLPVCYHTQFAPDLNLLAQENNLEIEEIIEYHSSVFYDLYFIGFLPGFLYLGGLDKKLTISRKKTPRKSVPKGSVGIGENQTGIYPKSSPGGWQIIGRCPVDLFNKNQVPPSPFKAGSKVKFYPVSKDEFHQIEDEVDRGVFQIKTEIYEG